MQVAGQRAVWRIKNHIPERMDLARTKCERPPVDPLQLAGLQIARHTKLKLSLHPNLRCDALLQATSTIDVLAERCNRNPVRWREARRRPPGRGGAGGAP